MNSWSPPQDPEYTSELSILSPVSPKPLHYSIPSNIPVLENQIDLAFNQTQAHMAEAGSQHQQSQYSQQPPPSSTTAPNATPTHVVETQPPQTWGQDGGYQNRTHGDGTDSEMNNAYPDNAPPSGSLVIAAAPSEEHPSQASHDHLSNPTQNLSDSVPPTPNVTTLSHDVPQSNLAQAQANSLTVELPPGVENSASGVDYRTLFENLPPATANAPQAEGITVPTTASPSSDPAQPFTGTVSSPTAGASSLPSSLPPRPPPQEQPSIHPNYTHSRDIRDYHPHSQNPALLPHVPQSATFRPNAQLPTFPPAPGQTNAAGANGLPPPPVASFQQPQPQMAAMAQSQSPASQAKQRQRELESQREIKQAAGEALDDADAPWTPEIQRLYDNFLNEERRYVTEGNWEQFPYGSRLFVGNLSSERVTKRDIFHVFHTYGALAQISIKQAYGFVQFLETGPCQRALQTEEGKIIRGKKIRTSTNLLKWFHDHH